MDIEAPLRELGLVDSNGLAEAILALDKGAWRDARHHWPVLPTRRHHHPCNGGEITGWPKDHIASRFSPSSHLGKTHFRVTSSVVIRSVILAAVISNPYFFACNLAYPKRIGTEVLMTCGV
jgi:hypothetical protein